jgi:hypothetical protein
VLASNAAAVKFDFTNPASENGYCGYAAITVFGTASIPPPAILSAARSPGSNGFIIQAGGLSPGQNYLLQSTTNIAPVQWFTETNFIATQSVAWFTNSTANATQKFYRVVGY